VLKVTTSECYQEVGHHYYCDPRSAGCFREGGHHHHGDPRCAGVDREVAARRAVCRASRLPCSRCTCTDAGTDEASPCRRRRWRRGRSDQRSRKRVQQLKKT